MSNLLRILKQFEKRDQIFSSDISNGVTAFGSAVNAPEGAEAELILNINIKY